MQATQPIAKKRRKKKQPIIYLSKERITSDFYASLKKKKRMLHSLGLLVLDTENANT